MKVVVVDDHAFFRAGVRYVLSGTRDLAVVGEASNAEDSFSIIVRERPNVVLMDMSLPGMDGVSAARRISMESPFAAVLVVSAHDQLSDACDALMAGASGYALKSQTPDTLVEAIRTVGRRQFYMAASLLRGSRGPEPNGESRKRSFRSVSSGRRLIGRRIAGSAVRFEISGETVDTRPRVP